MNAFVLPREGGADLLEERQVPCPKLRPRDILVRVQASAMNPVDTHVRDARGKFKPADVPAEEFPEGKILGYDGSGTVEQLGDETSMFRVGDRVYFTNDIHRTVQTRTLSPLTNGLWPKCRRRCSLQKPLLCR